MSLTRISRHHLSLLALGSALAFGACGDDGGDDGGDGNGMEPDARTGSIDSGPGGPDAMTGLPACANAEASYTATSSVEVVDFFGNPNVSLIFPGNDVLVVFPSGNEYGTGDFDLSAESEWTVLFCADEDSGNCDPELFPQSGTLQITNLTDQNIAGVLVDAVFVDDADSPTCQATVNVSFDEARP